MGWDMRLAGYGEKVDMANEVQQRYSGWADNEVLKVVRGSRQYGETPYYVAVKNKENGQVWAGIALTKRTKDGVWMKTMDETCGFGVYDAKAAKVVELLTDTDSAWAKEWREGVMNSLSNGEVKVRTGEYV